MAPQPEPSVPEAVSTALAPWRVDLKLPCVFYNEEFIPVAEASQLFEELRGTLPWKTNSSINRMTALHGEIEGDAAADESQYHYKDAPSLKLEAWTEPLSRVKALVESWYTEKTGVAVKFNVCLANYYIDGSNRIGWHTDREEIGRTTPIASISLGAPRKFLVRGSSDRQDAADIVLANGSLTIMENLCQHKYVHCIPNDKAVTEGRINLTFRCKSEVTAGEQMHASNAARLNSKALGGSQPGPFVSSGGGGGGGGATVVGPVRAPATSAVAVPAFLAALLAGRFSGRGLSAYSGLVAALTALGALGITRLWTRLWAAVLASKAKHQRNGQHSALALGDGGASSAAPPSSVTAAAASAAVRGAAIAGGAGASQDPSFAPSFLVMCQMGVEDIVREEVLECLVLAHAAGDASATGLGAVGLEGKVVCSPWGVRGCVAVSCDAAGTESALMALRTANHVLAFHASFDIPPVTITNGEVIEKGAVRIYKDILRRLKSGEVTVPRLRDGAKSFRVSTERCGKHDFSSTEVEFEAGGALQEFYGTKCKMKKPEATVRVDVTGERVLVGTQLNTDDLSKRRSYVFTNRVSLKSNLAACMLRKAGLLDPQPGTKLLDMFCGSGTVLLEWVAMVRAAEAAAVASMSKAQRKKVKPQPVPIEAVGIDVSLGACDGARSNAEAEKCNNDCKFIKCDAKAMRAQLDDGTFDAIVTNVPWGVQTGNDAKVDLEKLYEMVLRNSWHLLRPGGRVVMLVLRGLQVLQILRRLSFRFKILEMRVVKTSNNLPTLFVLERVESDPEYDQLKGELYSFENYVSMSTSTFMAVHSSGTAAGDALTGHVRKST